MRPADVSTGLNALQAALGAHYAIERELGRGGMATVYLARDTRHRRQVAIKVLHPELSAVLGPERFLREIELTASLQHPHILPLFDSGSGGGLLYYVMPYVEGETLRARLEREVVLPVDEAVRLSREVADALAYAHAHGVIHRDVKPENILLHGDHALVADFGVALAVQQAGGERMTHTGLSLGTPQYMAPEQAMGDRGVDGRADVYALGAVLYEMLVGEPPFTGPSTQAIVARVLTEEPQPVTPRRRNVPPNVESAVRTALEKLPADRFPNVTAFAAALGAPAGTRDAASPQRAPPAGRGVRVWGVRPRAVAMLAAGAVVAAAALGWAAGRGVWASRTRTIARGPVRFVIESDSGVFPGSGNWWHSPPAISPDGRTIVYTALGPNGAGLYVRDVGEIASRLLAGTEGADWPFFSPDGVWVAFTGGTTLRKIRLAGGSPVTVADLSASAGTFIGGSWSPDDTITYTVAPSGTLYRVPAAGARQENSPWRIRVGGSFTRTHYPAAAPCSSRRVPTGGSGASARSTSRPGASASSALGPERGTSRETSSTWAPAAPCSGSRSTWIGWLPAGLRKRSRVAWTCHTRCIRRSMYPRRATSSTVQDVTAGR